METNSTLNQVEPRKQPKLPFTHLHLHTSYSLLDGAIRIPSLMKHVKNQGMDAVAMTDHGNMFGAVKFYKEAIKQGVKPIIGCEFYVSPGKMTEKRNMEGKIQDGGNYHLVILAQNATGYQNLIKLASRSWTEGFYRKPRIDYELLANHNEGLVCLSACLGGEIQQKTLMGTQNKAAQLAGHLREVFGKDRFYLEIQKHGLKEEMEVARANLEIARQHDIRLVLTNDSHFLTRDDQKAQDILLRINQKKKLSDDLYFSFNSEFYVKNPHEMSMLFPEIPEAMHNTQLINEMCNLDFSFGNPLLPRFDVPEGYTLDSWMRKLSEEGLKKRYNSITPEIQKRFEFEFGVITSMDFSGYFLIVQDFINWAKNNDVPVGPGRGSAAGSIIAYALGITDIDPIRYGLLFERFLNPDRNEMPDIDVDFCAQKRESVINYVREKYGSDKVGQIITYGTMAAKACLKDVARVLEIDYTEANSISKMFPEVLGIKIDDALKASTDLRNYSQSGDLQKQLFSVAKTLEGGTRHTGIHPAGIVIAPEPLEQLVPLATVNNKSAGKGASRVAVVQYDMDSLPEIGLVKMDFLGLRNLTVIDNCLKGIQARTGKKIKINDLPLDDSKTYRLLQKGETSGVFQLESSGGMREFVIKIKPDKFEEIIALIALFRPGPLQSGMADSFINRKKGIEKVVYAHPSLEEVLKDTFGVIVYQEQVMQISRVVGGFTPGQADALRKAMGKKIVDKMEDMKIKFLEGAKFKNHDLKFANEIYDQMAKFAEYGFNKSHSAAYALIVYQTAYLKANYPTDYMRAVLDSELEKMDRLVPYINSCKKMGIKILGPDINQSGFNFTYIDEGVIRFGLGAVKNVGSNAVLSILSQRETQTDQKFTTFFSFMEKISLKDCNKKTIESLIHAGAFSSLGYTRKALANSLDIAFSHAAKTQKDKLAGQDSLFSALVDSSFEDEPIPKGDGALEFPEQQLLQQEKDVLGIYFSGHPLEKYKRTLQKIRVLPLISLERCENRQRVEVAGVITESKIRLTRNGKEMCQLKLEDMSGSIEATIFNKKFEEFKSFIIKDQPLIVQANIERKEDTGTISLIVQSLQLLNQELIDEKQEKSLHLKISQNSLNKMTLARLRDIIANFKGDLQIYFHLIRSDQNDEKLVIRAHESFKVNYSEELTRSLGAMNQIQAVYLSIGDRINQLYPKN